MRARGAANRMLRCIRNRQSCRRQRPAGARWGKEQWKWSRTPRNEVNRWLDGGQGQNRTVDTVIFSHVLYQLSYLAVGGRRVLDPRGRWAVKAGGSAQAFDLPEPQRLP